MNKNYPVKDIPTPKSPPQFQQQAGILSERLELLEKSVAELESRLSPVLSPEIENDGKGEAPEPPIVQVAGTIREANQRIQRSTVRIQSIINRIEV